MSRLAALTRNLSVRMGDIIASRPDSMPDPSPVLTGMQAEGGIFGGSFDAWLQACRAPHERVREMKYYDYLEREIPDVRKALDAYATMAVTGNLAGGGRSTYTIKMLDQTREYPAELKARLKRLEVLISSNAYSTTRTMVKYGSYMPEVVPERMTVGGLGVGRMRPIPPGTIFRNVGKKGESEPARYWYQAIDGRLITPGGAGAVSPPAAPMTDGRQPGGIPQWRLPHFAVWSNVVNATETLIYGTSILQPVGAIALKVHASLDAITVARLSRAAMRYIWKFDVSDIKSDQAAIQRRGRQWQRMASRSANMLDSGASDTYQKAPVPDQDFFLPAANGLAYDLDKLDGDTNLARVGDVDLLCRFYFGALGVPPEYLGHERSQGGRSNLSQVDIQFARTVRHIQLYGAAGYEQVVWVDMILGGYDPYEWPIAVVPPPIGARDDLLQAQIRALQATVIASLRAAGMQLELNPRWVLQTFMQLDEEIESLPPEVLDKIFAKMPEATLAAPSDPKKAREMLMAAMDPTQMLMIRENIRLLAADHIPMTELHRYQQPTPQEIGAQLSHGGPL